MKNLIFLMMAIMLINVSFAGELGEMSSNGEKICKKAKHEKKGSALHKGKEGQESSKEDKKSKDKAV